MSNYTLPHFEATQKIMDKINSIIEKCNNLGYIPKTSAADLVKLSRKYQVCAKCGIHVGKVPFHTATALDRNGEEIHIGYHALCFHCEIEELEAEFGSLQ